MQDDNHWHIPQILVSGSIPDDIEAALPPDGELPTISPEFGRAVVRLILALRPTSVLEFGAGASSVVAAMALQASCQGRLTTVEHAPQYSADAWQRVKAVPIDSALIAAPLVLRPHSQGLLYMYRLTTELRPRALYDFVVIDAPPGARDAALYQALPHLCAGAVIVLDDASRVQEGTVINRWLRACQGLELLCWNKGFARGVAVLRYRGPNTLRLSLRTILGTCHDRWVYRRLVAILRKQDAQTSAVAQRFPTSQSR